ncbi:GNAT family N-acetyltransferase [Streptomyces xanthophaeus]
MPEPHPPLDPLDPRPPLTLRPFRPAEDSPLLRTWVTDPAALMTWAGPAFSWPLDDAQLADYAAEPGRHAWTAVSPGTGPVGHASFLGNRLGRVLIAPQARGQGASVRSSSPSPPSAASASSP